MDFMHDVVPVVPKSSEHHSFDVDVVSVARDPSQSFVYGPLLSSSQASDVYSKLYVRALDSDGSKFSYDLMQTQWPCVYIGGFVASAVRVSLSITF